VEQFINEHKPDVVVYDVPLPYGSSWDLLDVIRAMPSLQSQRFSPHATSASWNRSRVARPSLRSLASPKTYGGCSRRWKQPEPPLS
jgi:hypothetical protein